MVTSAIAHRVPTGKSEGPVRARVLRVPAAGALAVAALAVCAGLNPARSGFTAGGQFPTVRARTEVVLVPVSPLNKHGEVIRGLQAKDFQLFVDGRPVTITSFDIVAGPSAPAPGSAAPAEGEVAGLPKSTFSNAPSACSSTPNLVIFLVDYLNTALPDRISLREQILKFLSRQLRSNQPIGIYGLTYSLALIQPFTCDPAPLIAAAQRLQKEKGEPAPPAAAPQPLSAAVKAMVRESTDAAIETHLLEAARQNFNINQRIRVTHTLEAFRQLAGAFSGLPGKKTVLWLTGDPSPLNPTLMNQIVLDNPKLETLGVPWGGLAKTFEALNDAGISVSPVDVRGVLNSGLKDLATPHTRSEMLQDLAQSQPKDSNIYANNTDYREGESANAILAMQTAAAETGGTVFQGSNDLGKLLDRAQRLWDYYYVLGFNAQEVVKEEVVSHHTIKVQVNTRVSQVLARRGFVTRPASLLSSEQEIQRDLSEAATSPIDLTGLGLALTIAEPRREAKAWYFPFSLMVGGDSLSLLEVAGGFRYELSFVSLARNPSGKVISSREQRVQEVVPPPKGQEVWKNGLTFKGEFEVGAGEQWLGRVVARDNLSGRVGTITVNLNTK